MSTGILAIIALACIFLILKHMGKTRAVNESFTSTVEKAGYDPYEKLEKHYYDAIEMVKTATVNRGNNDINRLMPASSVVSKHISSPGKAEKYQPERNKCNWSKAEMLARVSQLQPGHLGDKPVIVHGKYYHDWRYRSKPIDIEFAMSPKRYCKLNPTTYPCYVKKIQDLGYKTPPGKGTNIVPKNQ